MNCDWPPSRWAATTIRLATRLGDHRSVVAPHDMQAQVNSRRCPGRGQDLAVVDVENTGPDGDLREAFFQESGVPPVGGGFKPVEQARGGQRERSGADGHDARAAVACLPQRPRSLGGHIAGHVGDAGNDDGVRPAQFLQAGVDLDAESAHGPVHPWALGTQGE